MSADYERLRQLALDCEAEDGHCLACDQWKNHEMLELARGVLALLGELVAVREAAVEEQQLKVAALNECYKAEAALVAVREERDAAQRAIRTADAALALAQLPCDCREGDDECYCLMYPSAEQIKAARAALSVVDTRPEDLGGTADAVPSGCVCGHPEGWHRHGVGSCLECACLGFATAGTAQPCHPDSVPAAVVDTPQGET